MSDKELTRKWGAHLVALHEVHNHLVTKGAGLSQRQAAKALGVGETTVRRDLRQNGALSAPQQRTEPEPPKAEVIRERNATTAAKKVEIPSGKFTTIVIDPPWPMAKIERDVRPNQVEFDYPVMSEKQLQEFKTVVVELAADDCHMFMWTTQKFRHMAERLVELYGFRNVALMVWHKPGGYQPTGLPQFNCEFIIYARKGTPKFVDTKGFPCCFNAPRREHSRKPDEFYDIVSLVTAGPRIDVFSREPREGFAQFGNEADRFAGES